MQAEIIPELLIKNLRAVPSKKPDKHIKRLKKQSPGAAYLYREVILPKIYGKTVTTNDLDMSAFELEDIETVCGYYEDNLSVCRRENRPLLDLYEALKSELPKSKPTEFL